MKSAVFTTNSWESPLGFLRIAGPYEQAGIELIRGGDPQALSPELISQADLVVIQRDYPRRRALYAQVMAQAKEQGKPVVFELDDLLFELPSDHPDVQSGYYEETVVPMVAAMARADAVTVTTPRLAAYVRTINPNVFVLPNYLNDKYWKFKSPTSWNDDRPLVIGYMGGPSHLPDLQEIASALKIILRRYGSRVMLRVTGANPPVELLDEPGITWESAPTYVYREFGSLFTSRTIDIALAPLRDNLFNASKSAIKFLEYSAVGAAGVYTANDPYGRVVVHGKTGLLADSPDQWDEAISRLVESSELRAEIAAQAQEAVRKDWQLSQHAQEWLAVYEQVRSKGRKLDTEILPLERVLDRILDWQDKRATKEGLESAQAYELTQAVNKIRADTQAEIQSLETEAGKLRMERDAAESWVKGVLESRTWKLIQASNKFVPSMIRPFKAIPAELKKRVSENRWFDPNAQSSNVANLPVAPNVNVLSRSLLHTNQYDVVLFSIMDWETRIQRPQQLALQFAKNNHRVFYIQTRFVVGGSLEVTESAPNIWTVVLPLAEAANVYKNVPGDEIIHALENALDNLRRDLKISTAISLVDLPFWYPLVKRLRDTLGWKIIYDCMDYHAGFGTSEAAVLDLEDALVRDADLVLATSHSLKDTVSRLNDNCLLAPNAADFDHFRFAPPSEPLDIIGLRGPVIGYYGAIANWFDTRLLRYLALARPTWHFLLIGSTLYADLEPIQGIENIKLLGEKPYRMLPGYLHRFNAAIIPFKKIPLTDATNPVKLFEYLSAGKPVVATDLEELHHYADFVCLASTNDEWLDGLEKAIREAGSHDLNRRYEFARQNTWEHRINSVRKAIADLYPKVSIVVLTYNNKDFTRLCLDSLFKKTGYPNFEVIVVDNASTDGTQEMLGEYSRRHANLQVILSSENVGFAGGNNLGAKASSAEYIIFLNNDTIVTRGWLDGLLLHLRDPKNGMVGPVTNHSGNETRISVDYVTLDEMDAFAEKYTTSRRGDSFEIRVLAFMCVAMRKSVWDEIGPLDEIFGTGMFEDDDYAVRMAEKGYKLLCAEDVFIHHAGGASFSKLDQSHFQMLFEQNLRKFEKKWGRPWEPHHYREEQPAGDTA